MVSLVGLHFFQVWMMRQELENGLKHLTCHLNYGSRRWVRWVFFNFFTSHIWIHLVGTSVGFKPFLFGAKKHGKTSFEESPGAEVSQDALLNGNPNGSVQVGLSDSVGCGISDQIPMDYHGIYHESWDMMGIWYGLIWHMMRWAPKGWGMWMAAAAGSICWDLVALDGQHEQLGYSGSGRWVIPSP